MASRILETVGPALLTIFGLIALGILMLIVRLGWRWSRQERRLNNIECPHCKYPLRFNGSEYWCSECGYKHFLHVGKDREDA